jgi:hypothetical protein
MSDSPDEIPTFAELAADPEIAALLDFVPVPRARKAEAPWTPERQGEFVARLATHGSPGVACEEMGKSLTGMMKVYRHPQAASFRTSWHAAIDLARSRREGAGPEGPPPMARPPSIDHRVKHGRYALPRGRFGGEGDWDARASAWEGGDCPHCGDEYSAERRRLRERAEQLRAIRRKLFMARRVYLLSIADDPERRSAWELLCGPADWDAAAVMGAQPDEDPNSTDLRRCSKQGSRSRSRPACCPTSPTPTGTNKPTPSSSSRSRCRSTIRDGTAPPCRAAMGVAGFKAPTNRMDRRNARRGRGTMQRMVEGPKGRVK